jgi:hypothetical protein
VQNRREGRAKREEDRANGPKDRIKDRHHPCEKLTQYPGGGADPRTAQYVFDWRYRVVVTIGSQKDRHNS